MNHTNNLTAAVVETASIKYQGDGLWLAAWRDVIFMSYTATPTVPHLEATGRLSRELEKQYPRWVVMTITGRKVGLPDAATRKVSTEMVDTFREQTVALANVIEGEGFIGAASRSVITGIIALSRASYPRKVFSNIAESAEWLAPHVKSGPLTGAALRSMGERFRQTHVKAAGLPP